MKPCRCLRPDWPFVHALFIACVSSFVLLPHGLQNSANAGFYWTISGSQDDPFVLEGVPSGGLDTLHVWLVCANTGQIPDGMAAAEFGFEGTLTPLALTLSDGFLNAGSMMSPMLAAAGCPQGPVIVASILIQHDAPGYLCFGPSINGHNGSVDCTIDPALWPNYFRGYSSIGDHCSNLCSNFALCSCVSSVEPSTWGSIKSLYR